MKQITFSATSLEKCFKNGTAHKRKRRTKSLVINKKNKSSSPVNNNLNKMLLNKTLSLSLKQ